MGEPPRRSGTEGEGEEEKRQPRWKWVCSKKKKQGGRQPRRLPEGDAQKTNTGRGERRRSRRDLTLRELGVTNGEQLRGGGEGGANLVEKENNFEIQRKKRYFSAAPACKFPAPVGWVGTAPAAGAVSNLLRD